MYVFVINLSLLITQGAVAILNRTDVAIIPLGLSSIHFVNDMKTWEMGYLFSSSVKKSTIVSIYNSEMVSIIMVHPRQVKKEPPPGCFSIDPEATQMAFNFLCLHSTIKSQ